jgi:hypothetical protein
MIARSLVASVAAAVGAGVGAAVLGVTRDRSAPEPEQRPADDALRRSVALNNARASLLDADGDPLAALLLGIATALGAEADAQIAADAGDEIVEALVMLTANVLDAHDLVAAADLSSQ